MFLNTINSNAVSYEPKQALVKGSNFKHIEGVLFRFLSAQDVTPASRSTYERALRQFFKWVEDTGRNLDEMNIEDIISYKTDLMEEGKSPLTAAGYLSAVRRFYSWCECSRLYPDIARGVKNPRRCKTMHRIPLTIEEGREMLETAADGDNLRNFAIVNLMVRTGLRTIEVVRANVGDLQQRGGVWVLMVQGKGHTEKDSKVVLSAKVMQPLRAYLQQRGRVSEKEPLFVGSCNRNRGGRLTTRTISGLCKEAIKSIGINDRQHTAHALRHTAACYSYIAGQDKEETKRMLRHTSIATTEIYTAYIDEERNLQNAVELKIDNLL